MAPPPSPGSAGRSPINLNPRASLLTTLPLSSIHERVCRLAILSSSQREDRPGPRPGRGGRRRRVPGRGHPPAPLRGASSLEGGRKRQCTYEHHQNRALPNRLRTPTDQHETAIPQTPIADPGLWEGRPGRRSGRGGVLCPRNNAVVALSPPRPQSRAIPPQGGDCYWRTCHQLAPSSTNSRGSRLEGGSPGLKIRAGRGNNPAACDPPLVRLRRPIPPQGGDCFDDTRLHQNYTRPGTPSEGALCDNDRLWREEP